MEKEGSFILYCPGEYRTIYDTLKMMYRGQKYLYDPNAKIYYLYMETCKLLYI